MCLGLLPWWEEGSSVLVSCVQTSSMQHLQPDPVSQGAPNAEQEHRHAWHPSRVRLMLCSWMCVCVWCCPDSAGILSGARWMVSSGLDTCRFLHQSGGACMSSGYGFSATCMIDRGISRSCGSGRPVTRKAGIENTHIPDLFLVVSHRLQDSPPTSPSCAACQPIPTLRQPPAWTPPSYPHTLRS